MNGKVGSFYHFFCGVLLLMLFNTRAADAQTYCAAANTDANGQGSYISNVTFGTINNTTGNTYPANGYSYWPGQTTTVILGATENLSVSIGGPSSSYTGAIVSVWFDWNQDGVFSTSEWTQVSTNIAAGASQTISVTVPLTAAVGTTRMRVRSRGSGNQNGAGDACLSMGSGDTEDYDISVSPGTACSGTPVAGTIAPTVPDSICPNIAFALSTVGTTIGTGMTYQWEQSATGLAGSWSDIVGATNISYSVTAGITVPTHYRLRSVCSGGTPVYSNAKQVLVKSFINCYCTPTYSWGCSNGATINSFSTTGAATNITNLNTGCASGATGYSNYTSMTVSGMQSTSFNFSVNITAYGAGVKIWADWNHDGVFDPTSELLAASPSTIPSGGTYTGTANIPVTAMVGATRLRVRAVEGSTSFDPCSNYSYGETEDYTINVVQITPCTNPPAGGTITGVDSICPNIGFVLQTSGASIGSGLVYQWQSAPAATGPWTDIAGATTLTYNNTAGISVATHYRLRSICSAGTPVYSTVKSLAIKSFINCYCTPTYTWGCSGGATINSFSTTGAAANITNLNTGCANTTTSYSDYTSMIVSGMQTTTFDYAVHVTNWGGGVKIWADWNHDGVFDPVNEVVGASTGTIAAGSTFTGTATIPATALVGATRLRVRVVESSTTFDPCSNYSYGETEDYTIQVAQIVPCTNPPSAGTLTGVDSICPSIAFSLQNSGASLGSGLVYQWQSAPAATGPWTNIAGATTLGLNVAAGITANTYYRLELICSGGTPVYSPVKAVLISNPIACHCIPTYTYGCSNGARINSFSTSNAFVNVSNLNTACPSGNVGYSNYFNDPLLQITAVQSTTFDVAVQVGSYSGGVKIWADWNQDGVFDPVTELAAASTSTIASGSTFNGTVTIPVTSNLGVTKLRVRVVESSTSFDPCNNAFYGETEDYKLLVAPMPDCNDATFPSTATLVANNPTFCAYGNVTFTISPQMPPASSLEYIWESAPSATGPWTQVGSTAIPVFTHQGVSVTTHYRVRLLCHDNEIRNYGTTVVTVNNPGSLNVTGAERCGPGSGTLTATPVNPAHTVEWYNVFTGGTPIGTGTSFNTPVVATTTVYFAQPVGSGLSGCAAQRTPVYIYVRPNPVVELGNNIDTCVTGIVPVTLNPGPQAIGSTYLWNDGSSGSTLTTDLPGIYHVAVTNTFNCQSSDTISVNFRQNPVIDLGGSNATLCDGGVMVLDAGPDGENGGDYYWNTGASSRTINVTSTGTYTVFVTTPQGCSANETIEVTVGGNMPSFQGIEVTALAPTEFLFNAVNSQYVVSYHWDYGDGTTEQTTVPNTSHQYYGNGIFPVVLKTLSTCGEISDTITVTIMGLGINDAKDQLNVKVYPNPSTGGTITLETEGNIRITEVSLFNIIGQEVYVDRNVKGNANKYQLTLNDHLAPGIYNIRMQTNKGIVSRKVEILK